eukprot:2976193-Pleurochrysis_carterae.AAC.3
MLKIRAWEAGIPKLKMRHYFECDFAFSLGCLRVVEAVSPHETNLARIVISMQSLISACERKRPAERSSEPFRIVAARGTVGFFGGGDARLTMVPSMALACLGLQAALVARPQLHANVGAGGLQFHGSALQLSRACSYDRRAVMPSLSMASAVDKTAIKVTAPSDALEPRDVIAASLAAVHRENWDSPHPYYGFEVALQFLAPSHQAAKADAQGFARYMRQPHKEVLVKWDDYKYDGDVIVLKRTKHPDEAYQMVSILPEGSDDWLKTRWKLLHVSPAPGKPEQWMLEAVFANEPDQPTDDEFLLDHHDSDKTAFRSPTLAPRVVVEKVMQALRNMDTPYKLHGAAVATRYCAPSNRASELTPAAFAKYMQEPWYRILAEWEEMEFETDVDEIDASNHAVVDVLLRRKKGDSWAVVSWDLTMHDGRWLIHSLDVTE